VIIRYNQKKLAYQKKCVRLGTPLSRSHVSSMTIVESRILLSRSHVSSMTGGCTCPIYYQGVVSLEKGSVVIRYKLPELIKKVWRGTPPSRSHVSSMTMIGSRTLLSRSRVSSMTGGCTCPIYYQRVVGVQKGSVIIRYKLPELFKKSFLGESNLARLQPCFKHD